MKGSKAVTGLREWIDVNDKKKPIPFDMCDLILQDERQIKGWWTGQTWDGFRLKEDDEVKTWKRSASWTHC